MSKSTSPFFLFLASVPAVLLLSALFVVPRDAHAVIIDGGVRVPSELSSESTTNLNDFIARTSPATANTIIDSSGPQGAASLADLIKKSGLQNTVTLTNSSSPQEVGQILGDIGPTDLSSVLNSVGPENLGRGVSSLGDNAGNISAIAGEGNETAFLSSLSEGPLQESVQEIGGGSFETFVENAGPEAAAQTISSSWVNPDAGDEGSGSTSGETSAIPGGLTDIGSIASGLSKAFGVASKLLGGGNNANGEREACEVKKRDISENKEEHVPVKDFTLISTTQAIAGDTNALAAYLQDLCAKEYKKDPEAQHKWVQVAENLVHRTVVFVNTAYNNNPIFLSNPYVYFNKVEDNVVQTLIDEIKTSKLPQEIKYQVERQLLNNKVEYAFPRLTQMTARPDAAIELSKNWEQAGGWNEWVKLFLDPQNNLQGILALTQSELERRLQETKSIEEQKLAWGEGFFSYEFCDDTEFTASSIKLPTEMRNCRILTPGSLIKDQVSLILGTAIRQIENADEYDERISQGALTAWSNIVSSTGLRQTNIGGGGAVKPEDVRIPTGTTRSPMLPPPFNKNTEQYPGF
ncbi:MAG TPA: hypothetical protein VJB70_00285 [Candidatus Paceibacterota bacterium]